MVKFILLNKRRLNLGKKQYFIKKLKSLDKDFKYYEFFNKIIQNVDEYAEEFLNRVCELIKLLKNKQYGDLVAFDEYNNYVVVFKYLSKYDIFYTEDVLEDISYYEEPRFKKFKKFKKYLKNETDNALIRLDFENTKILEEYVFKLEDDNIIRDLLFYELDLLERE